MLSDVVTQEVMSMYKEKGLASTLDFCNKCLEECEVGSDLRDEKSEIKGQLGELSLMCLLLFLQKYILTFDTLIVRGLFVRDPDPTSVFVTELDVTFITPYHIFLFECKSYSSKQRKELVDKCTALIKGREPIDIFAQNTLHLQQFNKRYGGYVKKGSKPYKLVLYDYATQPYIDNRDKKDIKLMPVIRQNELINYLLKTLLNKPLERVVDVERIKLAIKQDMELYDDENKLLHKKQLMY